MQAHIAGIPCTVVVTHYDPGYDARTSGPVDLCHDGANEYVEWQAYIDGERAEWLHELVTDEDEARILEELRAEGAALAEI